MRNDGEAPSHPRCIDLLDLISVAPPERKSRTKGKRKWNQIVA